MHDLGRRVAPLGLVDVLNQISILKKLRAPAMPRESEPVDTIYDPCRTLLRKELDDPGRSAPDPLVSSHELSSERPSSFFVLLRPASYRHIGGQYTYNRANCMCAVSLCGRKGSSEGTHDPCGVSSSFGPSRSSLASICTEPAQFLQIGRAHV